MRFTTARAHPGRLRSLSVLHSKWFLYGVSGWRARRLTAKNGDFRPGQDGDDTASRTGYIYTEGEDEAEDLDRRGSWVKSKLDRQSSNSLSRRNLTRSSAGSIGASLVSPPLVGSTETPRAAAPAGDDRIEAVAATVIELAQKVDCVVEAVEQIREMLVESASREWKTATGSAQLPVVEDPARESMVFTSSE